MARRRRQRQTYPHCSAFQARGHHRCANTHMYMHSQLQQYWWNCFVCTLTQSHSRCARNQLIAKRSHLVVAHVCSLRRGCWPSGSLGLARFRRVFGLLVVCVLLGHRCGAVRVCVLLVLIDRHPTPPCSVVFWVLKGSQIFQ